jgi:hypothetical protein
MFGCTAELCQSLLHDCLALPHSEFETEEQKARYDQWFRAKVEEAPGSAMRWRLKAFAPPSSNLAKTLHPCRNCSGLVAQTARAKSWCTQTT